MYNVIYNYLVIYNILYMYFSILCDSDCKSQLPRYIMYLLSDINETMIYIYKNLFTNRYT